MKKNKFYVLAILTMALVLGFVFLGCDNGTGEEPTAAEQLAAEFNAIKAGIAEASGDTVTLTGGIFFQWLGEGDFIGMDDQRFAVSEGLWIGKYRLIVPAGVTLDVTADGAALGLNNMTFTVNGTVNARSGYVRFEDNGREATINGNGTIYLKGTGSLFGAIRSNKNVDHQKLILDGVTLVGVANNEDPLVQVGEGGELVLKSGKITGNTKNNGEKWAGGGGVRVSGGGTFIMEGGTISGNTVIGDDYGRGGGVCLDYDNEKENKFIMRGGTISGNIAIGINENGGGGGVFGNKGSNFIMEGGTISGNTANGDSGGVRVEKSAKFTMKGGTIYGNASNLPNGADISLANRGTDHAALSVGNQDDNDGATTVYWGTGGTYTKGGVSQTGGSPIVTAGGNTNNYGTDETLIAIPAP